MPTIFTRIIARRDPRHVRLARRPVRGVHVDQPDRPRATRWSCPIEEVDHWIDAPPGSTPTCSPSPSIGQAQQRAFGCERVGVIVAGYEVPHSTCT